MQIKHLFSIILLLLTTLSWSKTGVLDRIISIDIKATPVKTILFVIEERTGVQFSYNPTVIEDDKVVSLSIERKTIEFGLTLIFNKNIRFKEVGNYIVLLKNEDVDEMRRRKKSNLFTVFRGRISDKRTGKPIAGASIYDIDARYAAVSKSDGTYELQIPKAETIRSLYIRKKGFHEMVFVLDAATDSVIIRNAKLEPKVEIVEKMATKTPERIYLPIEDKAISGSMISNETAIHAENLEDIRETRIAQISFVPSLSIGSNLSTNGLIYNNFSLNVLGGYSKGVRGAEIGGLFNINKEDVQWFQAAGISNLVGGDVLGMQIAGISNIVRGEFSGLQLGGIANLNSHKFRGVQTAGVANLVGQDFEGLQLAGISNLTNGDFRGVQVSGIYSGVRGGFRGAQAAGISTMALGDSYGLQMSGIYNSVSGSLVGGQMAGIANIAGGGTNFLQGAGIFNVSDVNSGVQIAGIFNFAKSNKGLQLGLINISNENKGVSLGLVNFVKTGYHKTEISANEIFPINLTLKSGTRYFYNTYNFGIKFGTDQTIAAGLGLGTNFTLKNKLQMSIDLSAQILSEDYFQTFKFAQLYKFAPTIEYALKDWVTVFAGPTYNVNYQGNANDEGLYISNVAFNPFYDEVSTNGRVQMWIGGQIGLRF
ncbi:MAG: hypothetical protein GQ574_15540 [Crocinitomix sp.]|nr:hypothetical protein [Crocinitomix sp.]